MSGGCLNYFAFTFVEPLATKDWQNKDAPCNNGKQMEEGKIKLPDELINSIKSLSEMVATCHDSAAAMLYRLMFRYERNISVLDSYADQLLDGLCGIGSKYDEIDYKNYLQYLKVAVPEEYEGHREMFDEYTKEYNEDD